MGNKVICSEENKRIRRNTELNIGGEGNENTESGENNENNDNNDNNDNNEGGENNENNDNNENNEDNNTITRGEFNQIVNGLINENNQLRNENEKLRRQLSNFQDLFQNNPNKNGFNLQQNNQMMLNIGGANRNINNNDNITFALPDGNQYIIFLNNITKTSEALEELKIQRKDLPDIENLQFIYNASNITKYFTTDFEIRALNLCQPILVIINKK